MYKVNEKARENRGALERTDSRPEFNAYGKTKRKNQFLVKLSLKEYCIYCG